MKERRPYQRLKEAIGSSLAIRYMVITLASFAAVMSAIMFVQAHVMKSDMDEAQRQKIERLGMLIAAASGEPLLSFNFIAIESFASEALKDIEIVDVNFADKNGKRLNAETIKDSQTAAEKAFGKDNVRNAEYKIYEFPIKSDGALLGTLSLRVHSLETNTRNASMRVRLILMGVFGVCIVVVLLWYVTKTAVIRPVLGIVAAIDSADLNSLFDSERKDEIGSLQSSFDKFVSSIKDTLLQVAESASAVASASSEISSSTEQMAAGTQEQTSQAAEVASAVEEMTKTIIENSKNASNTADTAKDAKKAAEQGGQVVEETVGGMKRIAGVVKQSAGTVQELGRSSDQIGEIIGVIDDIADQTNLLALNAAIEAPRAGEQGRGFAVVADEVRKLAERTTKATKEIAGMIKKIQADTKGAVTSMQEGTKKVDEGILLADKAGSSLREIVGISQKVTDMVTQIAAASEQQSSASEQISKNVEAISAVTGETAQGVQQIARAAEDLNRLTEGLQSLVAQFNLDGEGSSQQTRRQASQPLPKATFATPKSKVAVRANGKLVPHS